MNKSELAAILDKHQKWLNNEPSGERANLCGADLRGANLRDANLDYSCWPLWCGSLAPQIDDRLARHLIYHVCRAVSAGLEVSNDIKSALLTAEIVDVANKFHRVKECGSVTPFVAASKEERDGNA